MRHRGEGHADSGREILNGHRRRFLVLCAIVAALNALILAMSILAISAVDIGRAYVTGEALYSKAQKSALIRLQQFVYTGDPARYREFEAFLAVPRGDRLAREALSAPHPDYAAARSGFAQGQIPPDDIDGLVIAFVRLKSWRPFADAVQDWRGADARIEALGRLGRQVYAAVLLRRDHRRDGAFTARIARIDHELTFLESEFSARIHRIVALIRGAAIASLLGAGAVLLVTAFFGIWRISAKSARAELELWQRNRDLQHQKTRAESADRAKSAFLANTSHELRTPLNAILGFSEITKEQMLGPIDNPRYRDYAADIHGAATHLLALINDVLDLSRIEAGRCELHEETFAVGALLRESVALVAGRAQKSGLRLDLRCRPQALRLFADRLRLKQSLVNLIANAVKFTPKGGVVAVQAERLADGGCRLCVRDSGIGMSAAEIALALEPFGQVDHGLNRRYEGTGLGLPITKRLAELHGGTLTVQSAPGEGTCVSLLLPAARVAEDGEAAVREPIPA